VSYVQGLLRCKKVSCSFPPFSLILQGFCPPCTTYITLNAFNSKLLCDNKCTEYQGNTAPCYCVYDTMPLRIKSYLEEPHNTFDYIKATSFTRSAYWNTLPSRSQVISSPPFCLYSAYLRKMTEAYFSSNSSM